MTNYKMQVEAKGKDLETAIASGLAELKTTRDDVIVEIIDEGRSGLLGIGSRDAVVKLTRMSPPPQPKESAPQKTSKPSTPKANTAKKSAPKQTAPPAEAKKAEKPESKKRPSNNKPKRSPNKKSPEKKVTPPPAKTASEPTIAPKKRPTPTASKPPAERPAPPIDLEGENADLNLQSDIAIKMIQELLDKMQVEATVTAELEEPDDMGKQMVVVNLEGEELNALVGVRGDTLNALQSVSRLMVGHQIRQRTDFVIDVNGYRQQRHQALTRMAERMAGKAVNRGKPLNLEPMPPHERRIIHMALRKREDVYTQSIGEGRRRKVRIIPTSQEVVPAE